MCRLEGIGSVRRGVSRIHDNTMRSELRGVRWCDRSTCCDGGNSSAGTTTTVAPDPAPMIIMVTKNERSDGPLQLAL